MGLWKKLSRWYRPAPHARRSQKTDATRAARRFEPLEPRQMLSAAPVVLGGVYIEEDLGSDLHGDTFEISFQGGAPGTELTHLEINGDQNSPGLGWGDAIFDTADSGLGADRAQPFRVVRFDTQNPDATVHASVVDGTSLLVLTFTNFRAGDKLVFTIDVDEVEGYDPDETDLNKINDELDPITSGIEFQGSMLAGVFAAPHYHAVDGSGQFRNRYDENFAGTGLDLPADDAGGRRDRTAGAVVQMQQAPLPVSVAGTVYVDQNLNLTRDASEAGLSGVALQLWKETSSGYQFTGHTTRTDADGRYEFGMDLNLLPGTYQVRETQPDGLFSVGATPGRVGSQTTGSVLADDPNVLTEIEIPLGDQHAVDYDFAEATPASISGYVYHDRNNNGVREAGEEGLAGVSIRIEPLTSIATQSGVAATTDENGFYQVGSLSPGQYSVVQVAQPNGYQDGLDTAGTVDGLAEGSAVNPGDRLENIVLGSGHNGIDYNFGEFQFASIEGFVDLSDADGNCISLHQVNPPIAGVRLLLKDTGGNTLAETTTDADGHYRFDRLLPGTYSVLEVTPSGLIDGIEVLGTVNGRRVGTIAGDDQLSGIELTSSERAVGYNFCEHAPASLAGFVYHDSNGNGVRDDGEAAIGGVEIALLDQLGRTVATVPTGDDGGYHFGGLRAGNYTVVETQPGGWLDGRDAAGTVGGSTVGTPTNPGDRIEQVQLRWGDSGTDYNFGELLPVSIAGYVFHDRDNDGSRRSGEEGLAGVAVQIIPLDTQAAQSAVTVMTARDGSYRAEGLAPGRYRIIEAAQPAGYQDGLDSAGTVNGLPRGVASNPGDQLDGIFLSSGQSGREYNFGEFQFASIHGQVHLSDVHGDCFSPHVIHPPLAGVVLRLQDVRGNRLAETTTDAGGHYRFENLLPGTYSVVQVTPDELIDGGERVGTVGGASVGSIVGDDHLGGIRLTSGQQAVDYDFCEHEPATLSGFVYHDADVDGRRDIGEAAIGDVQLVLHDADGTVVATTRTDSDGRYAFAGLRAGRYTIAEQQPAGWLDGNDAAGTIDGRTTGRVPANADQLTDITLGWGQAGIDFNFGEWLPSSIRGQVHADLDRDCVLDPGEQMLAGVRIDLLDNRGNLLASTRTDAQGRYAFENLEPGTYEVHEHEVAGYFHGDGHDGSDGTWYRDIEILSGNALTDYNFCEQPPASLSGYVFRDGAAVQTLDGQLPADLHISRDGRLTADDEPLAGVLLELRDGINGRAITADEALPGMYASGPIVVRTDASGFYEFRGLRGGRSYAVYQVHPEGYHDSIDTPGTTSGLAINRGELVSEFILQRLTVNPRNDAIILIPLGVGAHSQQNNFSEIEVVRVVPPPAQPPAPPVAPPPPSLSPSLPELPPLVYAPVAPPVAMPRYGSASQVGYTWHLSIVDAGMPRSSGWFVSTTQPQWSTSSRWNGVQWQSDALNGGRFSTAVQVDGELHTTQDSVFGMEGGVPISGDFNGDGANELGVFVGGQWFLDLNGNGRWDEEDLWAQLGGSDDLPVVGDWDGDGKDDIGIFGPQWIGDPRALAAEPGLPDWENRDRLRPKNVPPEGDEATSGKRVMQLTAEGQPRADVIDHVLRYGRGKDVPVAGDFNGDGIDTVGVFRDGRWILDVDGNGQRSPRDRDFQFGQAGDIPVVGDFDGNGVDEIGVYRAGSWILDTNRNQQLDAHDKVFEMGGADDLPVVGDWDSDGTDDPGVYRAA